MNLVAVDYQADNAAELFAKSLHETGFGVLKNHPIQKQLVEDIYTAWQAFFDSEDKFDYTYNKGTQDGYFSKSVSEVAKGFKKKDIKEYFHYYPWGMCPPELKQQLADYYAKTTSLAA